MLCPIVVQDNVWKVKVKMAVLSAASGNGPLVLQLRPIFDIDSKPGSYPMPHLCFERMRYDHQF